MSRTMLTAVVFLVGLIGAAGRPVSAQLMPKAQVATHIKNVENGVDEFRSYLEKRGDKARDTSTDAKASGRRSGKAATDTQKAKATAKADELDEALGDLNKSTNRLRRKFDVTDNWIETKNLVEQMMDDARKINPIVARGSYGAEAAKLWAVLRNGINDLARAYGVPPLAL